MPVLKISHGDRSAMMFEYLLDQNHSNNRVQAIGGSVSGRNAEEVEREFRENRDFHARHGSREYYHVAISFERSDLGDLAAPGGKPNYESIRDYGREWAAETGIAKNHDYMVVVHGEKDHPHAHVIWNATGFDGHKYNDDKQNLNLLRDVNDRLARDHGIKRELDRVRDPHRPSDRFIRQAQRGGDRYSWKLDMQDRIREAARRSLSEEDFRARLRERRVELRIRGEKYSFAMKDERGKQRTAREGKLGESYRREHLIEKFRSQNDQLTRDPDAYAQRLKEEKTHRYSWERDLRGRVGEAIKTSKDHDGFKKSLARQGVTSRQDEHGRYRFSFEDRHGLPHAEVPSENLYRGAPDRIEARLQENAGRGSVPEHLATVDLSRAAGREASGLVTKLMREVESTTRDPHHARDFGGPPTREDLRYERPRRHEGHDDWQDRW
jgi:Relaxase/Mobilisation nuclease domain